MVRPSRRPRGNGADNGGSRVAFTRGAFAFRRAANDNRIGLKGWAQRVLALAVLIGLAGLVLWKISG